ncbi:Auxin efflux carrier [Macleaya cordata]|uniref:Auxin efflux carrier n=1 Tax=Macleaya cordata TaxID=56857 RepID=A0A200PR30_MACCD|nr:Auxin efflux carrier [Macleaya cordata]
MAGGFWSLLEVASMPVLQVVFVVFSPALVFASLAKTVTLQDIISWWFMPVNIGLTFLLGGILGWIVVKLLKPEPHVGGLVIASCSAGNLGNLPLIIVPAICNQEGSPFGETSICRSLGLSYVSFSMALGGFYIWTHTYHLLLSSAEKYKALQAEKETDSFSNRPNQDLDSDQETHLLKVDEDEDQEATLMQPTKSVVEYDDTESQALVRHLSSTGKLINVTFWDKLRNFFHLIVQELITPPTIAAILGFTFGAVTWLKKLIIGDTAPLRVIQDTVTLLGNGAIPCITLILGGNLTQGIHSSKVKPLTVIGIICVKYMILPVIGIGVVRAAHSLGLLPSEKLFQYVLMIQFTLPPAMNIGTIAQLFDVGQEECSIIFLWTYLVAALALTVWSTVFLYVLS